MSNDNYKPGKDAPLWLEIIGWASMALAILLVFGSIILYRIWGS